MIFHRLQLADKTYSSPFKPTIEYPTANDLVFDFDIVTANSFIDAGGEGIHANSRWQVSTVEDFSDIVFDSGNDTTNKTSISIMDLGLEPLSEYYIRVRYTTFVDSSLWSDSVIFQTNLFESDVSSWADSIFNATLFQL